MVRHCFSHIRIYEQKPSCVAPLTQILPETHTRTHTLILSHKGLMFPIMLLKSAVVGMVVFPFTIPLPCSFSFTHFSLNFVCFSCSLWGRTLSSETQKSEPWSNEQLPNHYLSTGHISRIITHITWTSLTYQRRSIPLIYFLYILKAIFDPTLLREL